MVKKTMCKKDSRDSEIIKAKESSPTLRSQVKGVSNVNVQYDTTASISVVKHAP